MDMKGNAVKTINKKIANSTFYIGSYTDNVGSAAPINFYLRKEHRQIKRIDSGINKNRIMSGGFGEENRKCYNKTNEEDSVTRV